jgi:hypothetical protein
VFPVGTLYVSRKAHKALAAREVSEALVRHAQGDWGEADKRQRRSNHRALGARKPIVSSFRSAAGAPFLVATAADRTTTTVLLPEDMA